MNEIPRRNFIKLVSAAVAELALVTAIGPQVIHSQESKLSSPKFQTPALSSSPVDRFGKLDSEIARNPNRLNQVASEISGFACEKVGIEIGTDGLKIAQRQYLSEEERFVRSLNEEDGCRTEKNYNIGQGIVLPNSNKAFINLTSIREMGGWQDRVATLTLAICMHEALHKEVKKVKLTPPADIPIENGKIVKAHMRSGVTLVFSSSQYMDENASCMGIIGAKYEEAVVEQANSEWMKGYGFNYNSPAYPDQVKAYNNKILIPYFNGEYKSQLLHYINTDPDRFFGNIGSRFKSFPINHRLNPDIVNWTNQITGESVMVNVIPDLENSWNKKFHQPLEPTLVL